MYFDTLATNINVLYMSDAISDDALAALTGVDTKRLMTQISMLLDADSYTDTVPVPQTLKNEIIAEIDDKLLVDSNTAKELVDAVAPFAQ